MVQNITYETGFNMPTLMGNPKPPAILIPYRYLIQKEFQDCLTQLEDFSDDIVSHFARLEGPSQGIDLEQFGKAKPIFIHSLRDVFKITKPQDYRVVTALAMIKSGENKNADRKKRPCRKNRKRPRSSKQDSSQRNPFSSVSSSAPKTTKNNVKALFPSTTSTRHSPQSAPKAQSPQLLVSQSPMPLSSQSFTSTTHSLSEPPPAIPMQVSERSTTTLSKNKTSPVSILTKMDTSDEKNKMTSGSAWEALKQLRDTPLWGNDKEIQRMLSTHLTKEQKNWPLDVPSIPLIDFERFDRTEECEAKQRTSDALRWIRDPEMFCNLFNDKIHPGKSRVAREVS
eukprot:PhF_6_TR26236/c0_g2_i1/m.37466